MSLSVELDPNWTEWTNKFGKFGHTTKFEKYRKNVIIQLGVKGKCSKSLQINLNIYHVPVLALGKKNVTKCSS